MKAKEFLSQSYHLDKQIERKLEVLNSLNELAQKATATLTGMPKSNGGGKSQLENTVCKIIDLQQKINDDIDKLVEVKSEIITVIKQVKRPEYQMLLEQRYLCYASWEEISSTMHYGERWMYIMHGKALDAVDAILTCGKSIHVNSN